MFAIIYKFKITPLYFDVLLKAFSFIIYEFEFYAAYTVAIGAYI